MSKKEIVTIRIKIADYELEVEGPKEWAENHIKKFISRIKKEINQKSHE